MQPQILIESCLNYRHVNMNGWVFLAVFEPRETYAPPQLPFSSLPFIIFKGVSVLRKVNKDHLFRWPADILYTKQIKLRDTQVPQSAE